jgi:hypothetical protein
VFHLLFFRFPPFAFGYVIWAIGTGCARRKTPPSPNNPYSRIDRLTDTSSKTVLIRSTRTNGTEETSARQTLNDKDVTMRLNHWLATVAGILAMACGMPSAVAQSDPFRAPTNSLPSEVAPISVRSQSPMAYPPGYGPPGNVAPSGYSDYAPDPTGGADNWNSSPPGPASGPGVPGMQPWPQVTPFEHRYSEHRNEGGLWMLRNNDASRKYHFGFAAALFQLAKPESTIFGDKFVASSRNLINAPPPPPNDRRFIPIGGSNYSFDSVFADTFNTAGLRVNWGYWDADDTGLELIGWWASQVTEDFDSFPLFNPNSPPPFMPRGFAVPTNNGQPGGTLLFFDGSHSLRYRMLAANGQITKMARTIWEWSDVVRIRPTYGARYTFIREGMFFHGYNYAPMVNPYESFLSNDISTHLAGPEVGFHISAGGGFFKITAGTKFILYVNHELQHLNGENFVDSGSLALQNPVPIPPRLPFNDSRSTTHVSPAFEQTVHAEMKIFEWIPWVNRMDFFKNAKLQGGLTYLDIGEISRPSETIKYNSFPYYPQLKNGRSKFSALAWDVGLQFDY